MPCYNLLITYSYPWFIESFTRNHHVLLQRSQNDIQRSVYYNIKQIPLTSDFDANFGLNVASGHDNLSPFKVDDFQLSAHLAHLG